ncbi:hypothetical protein SLA2020_283200 [Shorea laevis]
MAGIPSSSATSIAKHVIPSATMHVGGGLDCAISDINNSLKRGFITVLVLANTLTVDGPVRGSSSGSPSEMDSNRSPESDYRRRGCRLRVQDGPDCNRS